MKRIIRAGFFQKIVLPAMLAIILFVISLYVFVIPSFERSAIEQKRQMLHELTNTAWSILDKYHNDAVAGLVTHDEAQQLAITEIEALRYGRDEKDYFWITDLEPAMIMHPYVHELTGQSLQDYVDPDGKRLFIEAAELARSEGEGFISYKWQLRDDSSRVVPKLSFIKRFAPWEWIIGTGIYLDDVQAEISSLTNKLLLILLGITIIIALIIFFITYQSLEIETRRRKAEDQLRESREKYRSLLESSTEGIILLLNSSISYTNSYIQNWLQYTGSELHSMSIEAIFPSGQLPDLSKIENETRIETTLICKDGSSTEALLTILPVKFADKAGLLFTFRDISEHRSVKIELEEMKERLRSISEDSFHGINHFANYVATISTLSSQTLSEIATAPVTCNADATIAQAIAIMNRNRSETVLLMMNQTCLGIITRSDVVTRFEAGSRQPDSPASEFMTSPVISMQGNATLAEAAAVMEEHGISHLAVKGANGFITGIAGMESITALYLNSAGVIGAGLMKSVTTEELTEYRKKIPFMVKPLLHELGNVNTFNLIISEFNDQITIRIIENAIAELGPPPVPFSFISFGSAGRGELTFNSDQDNAIIFADDTNLPADEVQGYFLALGEKVCARLDQTGLILCQGKYMASNSRWCKPLSVWKEYFADWIVNAEPENILHFSVFFDLRPVYGDKELYTRLEDFIFDSLQGRSAFFYFLAQQVSSYKLPVAGQAVASAESPRRKDETVDIKGSMAPAVAFARIYALHNNIRLKGTAERINALRSLEVLSRQTCDEVIFHYNFLMFYRLQNQISQIIGKSGVSNDIVPARMSEMEQSILKKVFSQMNGYSERLSAEFMSAYKG
jgi:PAS domain S-box-containing protein